MAYLVKCVYVEQHSLPDTQYLPGAKQTHWHIPTFCCSYFRKYLTAVFRSTLSEKVSINVFQPFRKSETVGRSSQYDQKNGLNPQGQASPNAQTQVHTAEPPVSSLQLRCSHQHHHQYPWLLICGTNLKPCLGGLT